MDEAVFEIYQDVEYKWRWHLVAKNGKIVADSGQGYYRRAEAVYAAERTIRIAQEAAFALED